MEVLFVEPNQVICKVTESPSPKFERLSSAVHGAKENLLERSSFAWDMKSFQGWRNSPGDSWEGTRDTVPEPSD